MGVVTKRIGLRDCGLVKVGSEEWRAELVQPAESAREVGADVQIVSGEGGTLKVKGGPTDGRHVFCASIAACGIGDAIDSVGWLRSHRRPVRVGYRHAGGRVR